MGVDLRRNTFLVGLQKPVGAQAPLIASLEPREIEFRARCA